MIFWRQLVDMKQPSIQIILNVDEGTILLDANPIVSGFVTTIELSPSGNSMELFSDLNDLFNSLGVDVTAIKNY